MIFERVKTKILRLIEMAKTHKWVQEFLVDTTPAGIMTWFAYKNTIITYAPLVDFSKRTSLRSAFEGCSRLVTIPAYDCSTITTIESCFKNCRALVEIPKMKGFGEGSKITVFATAFYYCRALKTIGEIDFSNATNLTNAFSECVALEEMNVVGSINISLNVQYSTKLSVESAKSIIKALTNYAGTEQEYDYTIYFSSEVWERLNAEGNTAPNGNTWANYVETLGWNA